LAGSSAAHLSVRSPRGESLTMAVVGLDIGDHSTYISLARQGGVDTIANDYTQRATPTIVALGGRQRFMGVSAENQRNLTVKNTVSYFKNFLGRKYKDEYVQRMINRVGAEVVELQNVPHAILVTEIMDTQDLSMPSPSQRTQIEARG